MRFSRHAKNKMRLCRVTQEEIVEIVSPQNRAGRGDHRLRFGGMMRADYDSEGDTIQLELEPVRKLAHSEAVEDGAVIVGVFDDRPVMLDVIGTRKGFEGSLRVAAERYDLDAGPLIAAARAALAVPDRVVRLDVETRIAA